MTDSLMGLPIKETDDLPTGEIKFGTLDEYIVPVQPGTIIEVKPGQKWIISLPPHTRHVDMAYIRQELARWWNSDDPFCLVLGDFKLVKLVDEAGNN